MFHNVIVGVDERRARRARIAVAKNVPLRDGKVTQGTYAERAAAAKSGR